MRSARRSLPALAIGVGLSLAVLPAAAHEVRPGYLELLQTGEHRYDVSWKVPAMGESRMRLDVRFPDSCRETAPRRSILAAGAHAQAFSIECPDGLVGRSIFIDGLSATMTDVLVRGHRLDGTIQVTRVLPEQPVFVLEAAPGGWQVAQTYLRLGVEHIVLGIDHLLFVLALLLLVRDGRRILATITAFTVAHSVTLALATVGWVHVPGAPVEAVIALSIVFVAQEIVHGRQGRPGLAARRPWIVAFVFGLLHGFGFAGALSEIGLPQGDIPLALLTFNVGVELGQLLFSVAVLALVGLGWRLRASLPRWAEAVPAYAIGGVAMFWVIQRVASLFA